MNSVDLRGATQADAPLVSACVCSAFDRYIERLGKPPQPMLEDYAQVIADRDVTVAECGSAIVGVLVLGPTHEGFRLFTIAVRPHFQHKGVGRRLLQFAEAEALRRGYDCIILTTNEAMVENQALYARIGYVEYDRRIEAGHPRVFFRKSLV